MIRVRFAVPHKMHAGIYFAVFKIPSGFKYIVGFGGMMRGRHSDRTAISQVATTIALPGFSDTRRFIKEIRKSQNTKYTSKSNTISAMKNCVERDVCQPEQR